MSGEGNSQTIRQGISIEPIVPTHEPNEKHLDGGGGIEGVNLSLEEQAALIQKTLNSGSSFVNEDLVEERFITIMPSPRRSAMRAMNERTMEPRIERIGSSVGATNALMQDGYLLVKYFPALVGESGTSPNFTRKVYTWLENISIPILDSINGQTFNISFRYDTEEAKKIFIAKRAKLDAIYDKAIKDTTVSNRKTALTSYINEIMNMERERAHYGMPIKLQDFIVWLHCLYYPDVAKDPVFLSIYSNVRMYIRDADKEKKQRDALQANRRKAMQNYLNAFENKELWKQVVVLVCSARDINYRKLEAKGEIEVEAYINKFMQDEPEQFNKLFNDPYRELKTLIEKGIAAGHLKRGEINQRITTSSGDDIGSNMIEAVAFYRDPANIAKKKALEVQLSL